MLRSVANLFRTAGFVALAIYLVVLVLGLIGWVMNLFKIIPLLDNGLGAWLVARIAGLVVVPLGALLGWF